MEKNLKDIDRKRTVAVVIGTGGIRSLAALPLLELLKNKQVPIDTIITTGGGAILAALFACGYSREEIPDLMAQIFNPKLYDKVDYRMVMKILGVRRKPFTSPPAPYKNRALRACLSKIFGERRIEDLPYHLQIQATDMASGNVVILHSGLISDCLYAANAIYPFMPPIQINGRFLAAGVFTGGIPILTAVRQQIDIIFVMSFNDELPIKSKSFYEYVNTFFIRSCIKTQSQQITLAISLHDGETVLLSASFDHSISIWDTQNLPSIMEAGEKAIANRLDEIDEITRDL